MVTTRKGPSKVTPKRDPLAALRMSDMVISKPYLPIELMSRIADSMHGADLIRMARVSRKMHEVIYDDTRWVKKLKDMGAWNDLAARRTGSAIATSRPVQSLLMDAKSSNNKGRSVANGASDVDDFITVTPAASAAQPAVEQAVSVFDNVKSVRGTARQEYGKIYSILNPFYANALVATNFFDSLICAQARLPEQRAILLTHVRKFSLSDSSYGYNRRQQTFQRLVDEFDRAALLEFRAGYEYKDIDHRMKDYARVMYLLNGGGSSVQLFLDDNRLLARKTSFATIEDCIDYSSGHGQLSLQRVQAYFQRLGSEYRQQASIIQTVFPQANEVSLLFLERIGTDLLGPFLSTLFEDAKTRSTSIYLRVISGSLHATSQFVQDFALPEAVTDDIIDRANLVLVKLFAPHLEFYLSEELAFFRQAADSEIQRWDANLAQQAAHTESFLMSNVTRQADKKDFMASFKKVVMMPVNILPSFAVGRPTVKRTDSGLNANSRSASPMPTSNAQNLSMQVPSDELAAKAALMTSRLDNIKTLFSVDVALNLVHAAKASMERAAQFMALGGQEGDIAKAKCSEIYLILLDSIGSRHVRTGFNKAIEHLSEYNPKVQSNMAPMTHKGPEVAPLTTFLELVNLGDLIQQMLDVFFEQEVVAIGIARRDDFVAAPVKEKKKFEQMLDEFVASGLGKGIDVLMDEVEYLCATEQKPTDFNPVVQVFDAETPNKRASIFGVGDIDISPTQPCLHIIDIISSHVSMLHGSTDKALIDVFIQEVAQRLFQVLVKHIKRQRISPLGAMRLLSDLTAYSSHIATYRNPNLNIYFNALREVSQIYLFEARTDKEIDEMSGIISDAERYRGVFTVEEVVEFAERRSDWLLIRNKVEGRVKGENCLLM